MISLLKNFAFVAVLVLVAPAIAGASSISEGAKLNNMDFNLFTAMLSSKANSERGNEMHPIFPAIAFGAIAELVRESSYPLLVADYGHDKPESLEDLLIDRRMDLVPK